MAYKIKLCGVDTANLPKMNAAQTKQALEAIRQGDMAAREHFLNCNLRLVLCVIHRFNFHPDLAEDVFQVGCVGLVKALNHFDPQYNVMFSTYAVPMIMGEIRRYLRENTAVKVSRAMRDTAYKVMQAKEAMRDDNIEEPTFRQIAQYSGIPLDEIVCAMDAMADPISLDEPAYHDGDDSALVKDQIGDPAGEDRFAERLDLRAALDQLPLREKQVIVMRYFHGKTQTEISRIEGVSQAQISRIETAAIAKLRAYMA